MKFSKISLLTGLLFSISLVINAQSTSGKKLESLLQLVDYAYVDTVKTDELAETAIRSMLKELDPHSVYVPADEIKAMNEPLVGKFEGVGIQFNILDDTILVTNTIAGGPSEKLGLMAGDRIVTIDEELVAGNGVTNSIVIKKLRGDKGTKVTVEILRRGEGELLEFEITRDKIPLYSVSAYHMVTPQIGYIKVNRFANTTVNEYKTALASLKEQGMKNLILDLTYNGGGYLNRAIELADEFLSDKKKVVYTEGKSNPRQESYATGKGGFESGKLVVMINESSASASEIVSGAIQDWDRGLIVGRRSFGKGLVQKQFPLSDGSAVRLTIARYYTPSGRCIQKPYGSEIDYRADIGNRYKSGELLSLDSVDLVDSLIFYTNAKRTVYGGGGIMPDVFVPLDTTMNSKYYSDLLRKAVLNTFTLTYVDNHRNELSEKYFDIKAFKQNFEVTASIMDDFTEYGEKKGVAFNEDQYKRSKNMIKTQIKALIARNIWNADAYSQIFNDINPIFLKAVEVMNDDTFKNNKIANN